MRLQQIHNLLTNKELSVTELVEHSLKRIKETDGDIKAFLRVDEENAKKQAIQMDEQLMNQSERGLLFGLPAGIKDNMVTEGLTTTAGSKFLENYNPIYDGTVVKKLKEAQSVTMGKLNLDEFAMGSSCENSAFFPTKNPWNLDCVPGGSSGGSAATVAAGQVYFSLGSDTGGSIRQPAAYCGVVGMKPTYGRVSRYGLIAFASSLDQIGPLTKNVEDCAYVLQAISGHDHMDSTSAKVDIPDYTSSLTGDIKGLRIGVPKEFLAEGIDPGVKEATLKALKDLEALGAVWEEVSLPHSQYSLAAYYLIAPSEASSNLARFDGVRYGVRSDNADNLLELYHQSRSEGFGPEVKRRIMLGTYALSSGYYDAYYKKAQQARTLIKQDFDQVFEKYDCIIGPSAPTTAFPFGSKTDDPLQMYLNDIYTIPISLAGLPAISVPCGFTNGLPVGLQIVGKAFDESTVLRVAHAYEQHTDHHKQRPNL